MPAAVKLTTHLDVVLKQRVCFLQPSLLAQHHAQVAQHDGLVRMRARVQRVVHGERLPQDRLGPVISTLLLEGKPQVAQDERHLLVTRNVQVAVRPQRLPIVIPFATRNIGWQVDDPLCFRSKQIDIDMGRRLSIEWEDSGQSLQDRYQRGRAGDRPPGPYSPSGPLAYSKGTFSVGGGLGFGHVLRDRPEADQVVMHRMVPVWRLRRGAFPPSRRKRGTGAEAFGGRGAGSDREGT